MADLNPPKIYIDTLTVCLKIIILEDSIKFLTMQESVFDSLNIDILFSLLLCWLFLSNGPRNDFEMRPI